MTSPGTQTATVLALAMPTEVPTLPLLSLPPLFAAGTCTVDSVDGMLMSRAYTWSLARPVRRLRVNIATTALTVGLAAVIGILVFAGVLTELGVSPARFVAGIGAQFELLGYLMPAVFMATWAGAALWWKLSGTRAPRSARARAR